MQIIQKDSSNLKNMCVILGFFDGIHLGHQRVIKSAVEYARCYHLKTILLTFKNSPSEFFTNKTEYIYNRQTNYDFIDKLGVDYLNEVDFSEIVNISAEDYLKNLVALYYPYAIFTGFNYTFGANKTGNNGYLELFTSKFNYQYYCVEPCKLNSEIISSTYIKTTLHQGNLLLATKMLGKSFSITSKVIQGQKLAQKLGFPTANLIYPEKIVKIPYGVYKAEVSGKTAVVNWGVKPTINGQSELIEVHIPNFNGDLYDKILTINFIDKIRNEQKFNNLEALRVQIEKDVKECLK